VRALGEVDDAHAARAEPLEQAPAVDLLSEPRIGRLLEESARVEVEVQELRDLGAQRGVAPAALREERGALRSRQLLRRGEQLFHALQRRAGLVRQEDPRRNGGEPGSGGRSSGGSVDVSPRRSSRSSQARANSQSRLTVAGEAPSAAADSSTESPAK